MVDEDQENNSARLRTDRKDSEDKFVEAPGKLMPIRSPSKPSEGLVGEVWREFRPYLVKMGVDFLVASGLWILLFLFKGVQTALSIHGWAGEFITQVHSAGVVIAFALFAVLFAIDLYNIRKSGK